MKFTSVLSGLALYFGSIGITYSTRYNGFQESEKPEDTVAIVNARNKSIGDQSAIRKYRQGVLSDATSEQRKGYDKYVDKTWLRR